MEKCKKGFIHGSFEMFNMRDLDAIKTATKECEQLIVGVYSDEIIKNYKRRESLISCEDRIKIVQSVKGVHQVIKINSLEQLENRQELKELILKSKTNAKEQIIIQEEKPKYKVGFVQGTFDMFHVGHLRLIERAKKQCEKLIVGVNTDELVRLYKHKTPIIPFEERRKIIESIQGVDAAIGMKDRNKIKAARELGFEVLIMGDDWQGTEFYKIMEEELKQMGVKIVYLPYTQGISSTLLRQKLGKDANGNDLEGMCL